MQEGITYEIHMLRKDSESVWVLWDIWDEEPTEDLLEKEMALSYCIGNYEEVKVLKVEKLTSFRHKERKLNNER